MGISETRWPGRHDFYSDGFWIVHSNEESQRGMVVILDARVARTMYKSCCEGDRLLMVKLGVIPLMLS